VESGVFSEDKKATRKFNLPGFFTYLRWVGEDLGQLVHDLPLQLRLDAEQQLHLREGTSTNGDKEIWDEYCGDISPIWLFRRKDNKSIDLTQPDWLLPDEAAHHDSNLTKKKEKMKAYCTKEENLKKNTKDHLGRTIRCHFNGKKTFKDRTKHFQCWNRNLRVYSDFLGQKLPQNSEGSLRLQKLRLRLQKLQVALDILYQLQAQRKPIKKADALACGGQCATAHRTAELMQIAVLDTMLGIITFSNCKSGLDRTGLYHALQSAIDQIHILYPHCALDLGFIAVHFWKLLQLSPSGASGTLQFGQNPGTQDPANDEINRWEKVARKYSPKCTGRMRNLLKWDGVEEELSKLVKGTSMHMFDIVRNAVLKNMLDIGTKVTFSSTGVAGLKYGANTAEYAAEECKKSTIKYPYRSQVQKRGREIVKGIE
jgi:hypothetical protein